ncbi:MAG: antibiotic biosynthesis monooxygenase [Candidatus Zixiibacteriota bacterium]
MFVAINFITCRPDYRQRFEELLASRVQAIDEMPGFIRMKVLRPTTAGEPYLVQSEWENRESFQAWSRSDAFWRGHCRGFDDIQKAKEAAEEPPMNSRFIMYEVIAE